MEPFVSRKCALRIAVVLAATAILLFSIGCGSSIQGPILGGGYSNASLKGQYVISQTGIGLNQSNPPTASEPFSETIVFTADGNGHLSVAFDDFSQSGSTFEDTNLTGSYSLSRDGTGSLKINLTSGSLNYAITMIDDNHFYIIQQDLFATASGYGEKQTATSLPAGTFVFKAHNVDTSARVGAINFSGNSITGNEDLLNAGFLSVSNALTGSVTSPPDANGHGRFTLNDGSTSTYFFYVVGANKFRFLSSTGTLEIGQAEAQTGGPFSVATLASGNSYVFGSAGDTRLNGQGFAHSAGVFSPDGTGHILSSGAALAVDSVQDAFLTSSAVSGGSYTLDSNGRGQLSLTLNSGAIAPQIFWMVDNSHAYFLVDSTNAVEDGVFTVQQPPPMNPVAAQSAFVMDGFDTAYKDRVGAFQPTTGTNFNWSQAANSFDASVFPPQVTLTTTGTSGTFQSSSNGRVTMIVNGVTNNLVLYFSSNSSGIMVQEDANIGGAFSTQASQ